jgi:hypothetical protein
VTSKPTENIDRLLSADKERPYTPNGTERNDETILIVSSSDGYSGE